MSQTNRKELTELHAKGGRPVFVQTARLDRGRAVLTERRAYTETKSRIGRDTDNQIPA